MELYVAAAATILVSSYIIFGRGHDKDDSGHYKDDLEDDSSHDEDDLEDDLEDGGDHDEDILDLGALDTLTMGCSGSYYIPEYSARARSTLGILEDGRKESRSSISPHTDRDLVTALANRLLSDESNNLTAEELRGRARNMRLDRQRALKQANRARKKGDNVAEAGHKQEVQEIQSSMKLLNQVAAEVTFIKKNKGLADGMVDFHGLHVKEALGYAKQELDSLGGEKVVRFIVGKGLHTKDGKPKIRPALENLCKTCGFTYYPDPENTGILVVHCRR